jgi:putative nucleotidyltransferase with HDIG domain
MTIGFLILYPLAYQAYGVQANSLTVIPIISIALLWGMKMGAASGVVFSSYISVIRVLNQDPDFIVINAIVLALVAGFAGGLFGLLTDQRKALAQSEEMLTLQVEKQTIELRRLLNELESAYETTLEGWAKALELRDKETEGHSRRVTEMTTAIARKLRLSDEEVKHIYYGALLHDIGKMGVPDEILNKEGQLTPEERKIVDQHPVFAHDLLKDIAYLRKAIEIPYSHHEHWDGTGYPQGLKGEDIPLSARIFAVVDYWDALTSDRSYREAWSLEQAKQYISDQSGKLFDPKIVNIFLEYIQHQ